MQFSSIGLSGMLTSIEGRPDRDRSIATIHAALDAGVTFIYTADSYHLSGGEVGHNESLIAGALASWGSDRSAILAATKGGHLRPTAGAWVQNGHPDYLQDAAKASAKCLGVKPIGLYQFHRPDAKVDYADSVAAIRDLLDDGTIWMAGIANAEPDPIRQANEILGGHLMSVQNQFSPKFRSSEPELRLCAELAIAFLPWSPLGGIGSAKELGDTWGQFQAVADARDVSPQQVCLAWELALTPIVIPIPGATRPESIADSVKPAEVQLTDDELERLSQ